MKFHYCHCFHLYFLVSDIQISLLQIVVLCLFSICLFNYLSILKYINIITWFAHQDLQKCTQWRISFPSLSCIRWVTISPIRLSLFFVSYLYCQRTTVWTCNLNTHIHTHTHTHLCVCVCLIYTYNFSLFLYKSYHTIYIFLCLPNSFSLVFFFKNFLDILVDFHMNYTINLSSFGERKIWYFYQDHVKFISKPRKD